MRVELPASVHRRSSASDFGRTRQQDIDTLRQRLLAEGNPAPAEIYRMKGVYEFAQFDCREKLHRFQPTQQIEVAAIDVFRFVHVFRRSDLLRFREPSKARTSSRGDGMTLLTIVANLKGGEFRGSMWFTCKVYRREPNRFGSFRNVRFVACKKQRNFGLLFLTAIQFCGIGSATR